MTEHNQAMVRPARSARPRTAHLLLAVLLLLARLLGPAMPAAAADRAPAGMVICHAGGPAAPEPEPAAPAPAQDCLLCPACHLVPAAVLPAAPTLLASTPTAAPAPRPAVPPPATGPPHPARLAARPTGPPAA